MSGLGARQVVVGRVGKPFGVDGGVYVFADPDLDDPLRVGSVVAAEDRGSLTVQRAQHHKGRLVVHFDGVGDRPAAEALRGVVLTTTRDDVTLPDGGVWIDELKGRQVVDAGGELIGVVGDVLDGHAHDYLLLARPDGGETLVPMVEEIIDWSSDPLVITPPAGLLDPDEGS